MELRSRSVTDRCGDAPPRTPRPLDRVVSSVLSCATCSRVYGTTQVQVKVHHFDRFSLPGSDSPTALLGSCSPSCEIVNVR